MATFKVQAVKVQSHRVTVEVDAKNEREAAKIVRKYVRETNIEYDIQDSLEWTTKEHVQVYFVERTGP